MSACRRSNNDGSATFSCNNSYLYRNGYGSPISSSILAGWSFFTIPASINSTNKSLGSRLADNFSPGNLFFVFFLGDLN